METLAFLGLLGLGYATSPKDKGNQESFVNSKQPETRAPTSSASGSLDVQYQIPSRMSVLPREPHPDSFQGDQFQYATKKSELAPDAKGVSTMPLLQMRPDSTETATPRDDYVSPLSGVAFRNGDFKHNNMVPFFRGQMKQNTVINANRQVLDDFTGAGSLQFAKREQTPFFEPTKTPMGNPFGLESTTDFQQSRINDPRNRANEKPIESIRVGPGLNQGYTQIPSGGFHQQEGNEYLINRMPRTDDLRVATNPKLSYGTPVVPGSHYIGTGGTAESVGEVRKYNPDRFFINQNGERNFVTTGADVKSAARATQVVKNTTRMTSTREYAGHAGQAEGKATYTVGSTKAPLTKQHGPYGYRNADASSYFNKNTDAEQNDYGKAGVEIRPNERFYTGERVHATNLAADQSEVSLHLQDNARATRAEELIDNIRGTGNFNAMGGGLPGKLTVHDPNDITRTTIKETTIDNDWLGVAAPASAQPKRTAYDPNDIARTTVKETTIDNDWIGTIAPVGSQPKLTVYDPNDLARTTVKETTIDNDWLGSVAPVGAQPRLTVYDPNDFARTTVKETTIDNDWLGSAAPASAQPRLTVYDPNDVARTTIKETTADNDWLGGAAAADQAQKLTVYDPDDVARVTGRNTLSDWDTYRNFGTQTPEKLTNRLQDPLRNTQKAVLSGKSAYAGAAGSYATETISRTNATNMRHYAQRETVSKGRAPTNTGVKLYNGEDYVNIQYRKIVADSINDRDPIYDRVSAETPGVDVIGIQRPRASLKLDVDAMRNNPEIVSALESNPYVIPLHKAAV
jgi:hypothetical protein